jgi:hypothetical protein
MIKVLMTIISVAVARGVTPNPCSSPLIPARWVIAVELGLVRFHPPASSPIAPRQQDLLHYRHASPTLLCMLHNCDAHCHSPSLHGLPTHAHHGRGRLGHREHSDGGLMSLHITVGYVLAMSVHVEPTRMTTTDSTAHHWSWSRRCQVQ